MADTLFAPIAQRLLDCWELQLNTLPADLKPQRIGFRFDGDAPTMGVALSEDECKCGTAWVRVVDWFVSSDATFPAPDTSFEQQICPTQYGLVLEVGIGRCPPTGDETVLETVAERDAFHALILEDVKLIRLTLNCCFGDPALVPIPEDVVIGAWSKTGPQGKCFTQAIQLTVRVINCDEC